MTTAYLYSPVFLEHQEPGHPESPERLNAILHTLAETGLLARLIALEPLPATDAQIEAAHTREHLARVKNLIARGGGHFDADTYANARSLDAALLAVGALTRAVDAVMAGQVDNAFAFVRPPGHHATRTRAMGFCIFNNVAIAAQHALAAHKLDRVLIVDYDVHHGNGTQEIFCDSSRVFYFSTHQSPHYPGTGDWRDIGAGTGTGFTANVPLPARVGDEGFQYVFDDLLYPLAERYRPQLILVSAGYDAHWSDPLAMENLTIAGYGALARTLVALARERCAGRIIFTLEGGYNLPALAHGVAATCRALLGDAEFPDPLGASPREDYAADDIRDYVEHLKGVHRLV
ncbi:MAG: histone deacetylase [Anaerolineales bacterium]|nr:histone deacetylase [Anaerolineales bacterium]